MRRAAVYVNKLRAGVLEERDLHYQFIYDDHYDGQAVSLTMPIQQKIYEFDRFPPFFEGLLPEGVTLEVLVRKYKLDRDDYFSQLLQVGHDVVGAVTIEEIR